MRRLIYILLILVFSLPSFASFSFNKNCRKAFDAAVEFRFNDANKILQEEKKQRPDNLIVDYISNYIHFLKIINSEEDTQEELFLNNTIEVLEKFENSTSKSPYRLYCITDIYLQRSVVRGRNKSFVKAYNNLRDAQNSIEENQELYPHFIPNKKALAILHLGFGSIPESYDWILSLLNIDASVSKGQILMEELTKASLSNESLHFLQTESILLASFAYNNLSNKSHDYLKDIVFGSKHASKFQKNPLLAFAKVSYLQHKKKNDDAFQTLLNYKKAPGTDDFYFLEFLRGESYLYKLDPTCIKYFDLYINKFPGDSYRRSAIRKKAWMLLITKGEQAYKNELKNVEGQRATILDADKQALKEHEKGETPNIYLLKSRLLFDGGYYAKAIAQLSEGKASKQINTDELNLEYLYRMGRIYDEWGKTEKALQFYRSTIEKGKGSTRYFAANAALMSGLIYEKRADNTNAIKMYNTVMELDFDEYYDSLTQKAKAGLNRIDKQ